MEIKKSQIGSKDKEKMMRLKNKVAIITGSANGIGQAGALLFAKEGAKVVIADINRQGELVAEKIKQQNNEATFIHTDLCSVSNIQNMVEITIKKYGKIDIFWHNAGIPGPGSIDDTTEEEYEKAMAIHLKAGVFGAKFVIPEMRKLGTGCILFTSSISGLKASPAGSVTYSLAKAGLVMLTKCLAISLAGENIRVNCICPGPIDTPLLEGVRIRLKQTPEEFRELIEKSIPIGRHITLDEVIQAALFLVSDGASAITAVNLPVDGGMTAT